MSREKLRDIRSLNSVKIRKRKGLCIVEGERALAEAVQTGNLLYLVASDKRMADPGSSTVVPAASDVPLYNLAHSSFREVSDVKTGTGLLGVAKVPVQADPARLMEPGGRSFLFYLDCVQEPGNVGAIIRTAWALGGDGVLLGTGTADPFTGKGVRTSAGGVFHLPLYGGIGRPEIEKLTASGYTLYTASREGTDYRTIKYPRRMILALGNEGAGAAKWVAQSGLSVGIPLAEGVDSLNVVVAGGIIAAEMSAMIGHGETEKRRNGEKPAIDLSGSPVPPFPVSNDSGTVYAVCRFSGENKWAAI